MGQKTRQSRAKRFQGLPSPHNYSLCCAVPAPLGRDANGDCIGALNREQLGQNAWETPGKRCRWRLVLCETPALVLTQGLDTATPPLCTVPGAGSDLLTFLPDTLLPRPSFGNLKDMPREGGNRVSKPRSRTVSLETCSGSSRHGAGSLQSTCSNRHPTKPEEDSALSGFPASS